MMESIGGGVIASLGSPKKGKPLIQPINIGGKNLNSPAAIPKDKSSEKESDIDEEVEEQLDELRSQIQQLKTSLSKQDNQLKSQHEYFIKRLEDMLHERETTKKASQDQVQKIYESFAIIRAEMIERDRFKEIENFKMRLNTLTNEIDNLKLIQGF